MQTGIRNVADSFAGIQALSVHYRSTRQITSAPAMHSSPNDFPAAPERWRVDAGDAAIAKLEIPADLRRERDFEIAVMLTVRAAEGADAWHRLRVYADGEMQWSRRVATQNPGAFDGLEFRFRRQIAVGQALRLRAQADCHRGRRLQLVIEADET
jgi:hypothetical protein